MSTFLGLHYHLIFSTKHRERWIPTECLSRLHEYMGGVVYGLGGEPHGIGGIEDHVHLLVSLKATHCLSDFMRELKKAASRWMHEVAMVPTFAWQDGYCALTVSPSGRDAVNSYIANQAEHHCVKSFRDELEAFLKKAGVAHDDRYLE